MPLLQLLYTTTEDRRVYSFYENINGRQLNELHIDSHYEEEHGNYMTDEMIYELAQQLVKVKKRHIAEDRDGEWEYFSFDRLFRDWRAYKIAFCLRDNANFLGIRTCYRYHKNDKKDNKE